MFRTALITALIIATTPALASQSADDFCRIAVHFPVRCLDEYRETKGGCLHQLAVFDIAIQHFRAVPHQSAADAQMKIVSLDVFDFSEGLSPKSYEDKSAFEQRIVDGVTRINAECQKLRLLDN
jgi:hypothetical protein